MSNGPAIQVTDPSRPFPIRTDRSQPQDLLNVPGGAEVWVVGTGGWFLVYNAPGTNPPVPMAWAIRDPDQLKAVFGDQGPVGDRYLTEDEFYNHSGAIEFGYADELANQSEHPFQTFIADFEKEAAIRPWLKDPEVLALTTMALLEGRQVSEAELKNTEWWRSHTEGERQWLTQSASDPATAQQVVDDRRRAVRAALTKAGVSSPPDSIVNLIADRWTFGQWTESKMLEQVQKLADPMAGGTLDADLAGIAARDPLHTIASDTRKVKESVAKWLGPAFAGQWSDAQLANWAGRLRNDPNAEADLEKLLQGQRLALFPEYADPNLTYDDIAGPWRGVVNQVWGQTADETDPLFPRIVRMNDLASAEQTLRTEGLKRGIGKVANDALSATTDALGGGVRKVI